MSEARRRWVITTTLNDMQLQGAFIPILDANPDLEIVLVTDHEGPPLDRVSYVYPSKLSVKLFGRLIPRWLQMFREMSPRCVERVMVYDPVPHLMLAIIPAKLNRKPLDVQLIAGTIALNFVDFPGMPENRVLRRIRNPRMLRMAQRFVRWLTLKHCDRFFTTGSVVKEWLVNEGIPADHIFETPGTVNTDRFVPSNGPRDIDVITVASLIPRKRPELTLQILEGVLKARPGSRFVWLGGGFDTDRVREEVSHSPLRDALELVGHTSDVPGYYARSKVSLLNSVAEGLPQATMEAMASLCVPVCSNVGDARDIILQGETGYSIDPHDKPEPYVKAILELLNDEERRARMGVAARDLIIRDHSYQARVESWKRVH